MTTNHNTPFLLIQTPRAGKWNYRHITPPNLWINQQQVLAIIEAARKKKEGKNFLAVGHDNVVKQLDGNRSAPELLILAGINTKSLSGEEKQVLRDSLQSLLGQVDKLVTQEVDWNTEGENDPVAKKELANWFDDHECFKRTQHLVWKPKPKWLFPVVVAVIVSITLIFTDVLNKEKEQKEKEKQEATDKANKEKHKLEILTSICGSMNNDQEKTASEELKNEKFSKLFENPQSDISVSEVFTMKEKPKGLFPALFSENPNKENLNKDELKTLIACKRTINTFTDKNQFTCNPLIGDTEIDTLEQKIKTYQDKNKDFYEGVIEENSKAKYCGEKINKIEFLTKCYDSWAEKKLKLPKKSENERFEFWKKAGHLLESCRKVGS